MFLLALFGLVGLLNLVASALELEALEWATKPLLMPLLALWVWRSVRDKGIVAALLLSAAGDIALLNGDNQLWFIAGMVFFLGAHISYITTFLRNGAVLKPLVVAFYTAVLLGSLLWLWKPLGAMAYPMTIYAIALGTMATLAASFGWRIGVGGGLFLLSDLLIAVRVADAAELPGPPIWVMLTYIAAQTLIATGWVRYRRARD